jgi:hypothetical protein
MKLLNNISKIKSFAVVAISTAMIVGCSDYLDVDTDTDYPTKAPLKLLLTSTQVSISRVGDFNVNGGQMLAVYTHQMTTRENPDQYGTKVDDISMNNDWNDIYLTLTDIESLINQSTQSGDLVYAGIGKIQKAYLMSVAVDLWGDVPFSEATQLVAGIKSPKFDNQKAIYNAVFDLINAGKADVLTNAGTKKPAADDLFYAGNRDKWVRFANTLKLKLYNQTRLTTDFDQTGFNALIAENNFFINNGDDFQFKHFNVVAPSAERNRLFRDAYESTQFGSYQSPWFYEIMKGVNPNIHTGNPDPRMNYYFYNQLAPNQFPPDQGSVATGNPRADYWDKSTGFFSIRFGSNGPDRDLSAENSYTYPGIFQCGGRYNDGLGGSVALFNSTTFFQGRGIAPKRMLTYDEFLYIQAELIEANKLTGSASTKLQEAMEASFKKVDQVVSQSGTTQTVPVLSGSTAVNTFIANVIAEYNAAVGPKKLEVIMTQKWVATAGDPTDQYTDYRRTGFPILVNPLGTTPEYQLNNGDAFPINDTQTVLNNPYQVSLFWPQTELNANSSAPGQKNPATYKIFWDN